MKMYLVTDSNGNFIALLARREDVDEILDYGDEWKEIHFGEINW